MTSHDDAVARALAIDASSSGRDRTIDITTTGRRSGEPRRIETWFYRADDRIYLSGRPGRRGWASNLRGDPAFTFHLKHGVQADLPARATEVTDEAKRRRIFTALLAGQPSRVEEWLAGSPLFEVAFEH